MRLFRQDDEMKKFKSRKNIAEFERKAVVEEEAGHLQHPVVTGAFVEMDLENFWSHGNFNILLILIDLQGKVQYGKRMERRSTPTLSYRNVLIFLLMIFLDFHFAIYFILCVNKTNVQPEN